jgi:hypothetical protein
MTPRDEEETQTVLHSEKASRNRKEQQEIVRVLRSEDTVNDHLRITRGCFLKRCGVLATGAFLGQKFLAAEPAEGDEAEALHLKSWQPVEFPNRRKFRQFIKITASDGSIGYSRVPGGTSDLKLAEQAVAEANLLDHEKLYDVMVSKHVPESQRKVLDIAC